MSDGCTDSPDSGWWGVHRECCLAHDRAYYFGGSKALRLKRDLEFYACLRAHDMPMPVALLYYRGVRIGGHPMFRRSGVSWGFGGRVFSYTERPAKSQSD